MIKESFEPSRPDAREKKFGIKFQGLLCEFLGQSLSDILSVEEFPQNSPNDAEHVDILCRFVGREGCLLGVDATADRTKLLSKIEGIRKRPIANLEDEHAKPTGERAPKVVYFGGRTGLWEQYKKEAQELGIKLIDVMPQDQKTRKQVEFIEGILSQSGALVHGSDKVMIADSRKRKEYDDMMLPVREILQKKLEELKVVA